MTDLRLFNSSVEFLNANTYDSILLLGQFRASWNSKQDTFYTAILSNITTKTVHYLAINIPGCDMSKSTALLAYQNFNINSNLPNTIRFAVYIQSNYIEPVIIVNRTPINGIPLDTLFVQYYKLSLGSQITFLTSRPVKKISSPRPSTTPKLLLAPVSPRRNTYTNQPNIPSSKAVSPRRYNSQ